MNGNIGQMGAATIAAYVITFTTLYSSIVFIKMQSKYKWFLFYANFALSFAAVMMTGTRAAIFTFPLMIMVILFLQHRDQKVFLFKGLSGVFILLLACGLIFNKEIDRRINSLKLMLFHMLQKITVNPRSEHVLQWLMQELKEVLMVLIGNLLSSVLKR